MNNNYDNIYILLSIILVIILVLLILRSIGSMTIYSPNIFINRQFKNIIYSVIISILLLIPIFKKSNLVGVMAAVIIAIILYIIFTSYGVTNLQNILPSTDYPPPTHLGLDGVSLQTIVSGGYK